MLLVYKLKRSKNTEKINKILRIFFLNERFYTGSPITIIDKRNRQVNELTSPHKSLCLVFFFLLAEIQRIFYAGNESCS